MDLHIYKACSVCSAEKSGSSETKAKGKREVVTASEDGEKRMDLRTVGEVGLVGLRSEERGAGASRWLCRLGQLGGGWGHVLRGRGSWMTCPGSLTFSVEEGRVLRLKAEIYGSGASLREASCAQREPFQSVEEWKTESEFEDGVQTTHNRSRPSRTPSCHVRSSRPSLP